MKHSWVVFIESNTTGTGRLFAKAAAANGYRPVLLAELPGRYPYLAQDSVDCVKCNTGSVADVGDALECLSREAPLAGIFSSSEYFVETAATFAAKYALCGPNPAALKACRNKWTQRQRLKDSGFTTPKFEYVTSVGAAGKALERIPLPVVLKPTMGSGSVGVRLCRTADEVFQHATLLLGRTVNERGMPVPSELLIEEYLVGPEYSVEMFAGEVLGITRKHVSGEPFFVELGHDFPTRVPPALEESIVALARRVLQSLELQWGPAHIEMRVTEKGPTIIEINPRLAGGFIPEIVRLASDVDMIRQTVKLVLGEQPEIRPKHDRHASIRFLTSPGQGIITGIKGVEAALREEGVTQVQTYRNIGDRVRIENDFRDRIGHVIACADQEITAARACELARDKIEIQVEPQ